MKDSIDVESDSLGLLLDSNVQIMKIILCKGYLLELLVEKSSVFVVWCVADASESDVHDYLLFLMALPLHDIPFDGKTISIIIIGPNGPKHKQK